ncbi:polysaccharide deacetylase family protein [Desnuesiella massiliensis]|uniref:polysaccharide deacetylase family protein n=1 Tax=Desnuesiella massiliensis TaxID=1650662 RepID=UPI0006E1457A|nr:hypothetical protein [Desnuesiella massiliensis]
MKKKTLELLVLALLGSFVLSSCTIKEENIPVVESNRLLGEKEKVDLIEEIKPVKEVNKEVELVDFQGTVEHLFFHPLILDKEAAFKGPKWNSDNMDDWFVTVEEFSKVLESLYSNNYVLVDANELYEEVEVNGIKLMKKKNIRVPKEKKPLIISIDDLSYNEGMRSSTAQRLILDQNNQLATYRKDKNGKEIIGYDETVILIDKFVEKHPDFSIKGAKGIIALTGYEGIFGYKSDYDSSNYARERAEALRVGNKLKENGWKFASHSYGHNDNQKVSLEYFKRDIDKWEKEVATLVGSTQIYIYPHGSSLPEENDKFKYLQSKGFKIFYAVGSEAYEKISNNTLAVMGDRMAVDGITLRHRRKNFLKFYDAKEVIDLNSRPDRNYNFK